MEWLIFHPEGIRLAERAAKMVRLAVRASNSNLNVIQGTPAKCNCDLLQHLKDDAQISWIFIETQSEDNKKIGFDLCEPILFRANERAETVTLLFIIRKRLNTSYKQLQNSHRTKLVRSSRSARLGESKVKTTPKVEQIITEKKPQIENTDEVA